MNAFPVGFLLWAAFWKNSASPEEFMEHIVDFYKDFGVGKLGLHKAFRLEHKNPSQTTEIIPITRVAHVKLDDLVGYELEKEKADG